jgi:hypothetical protein
MYGNDFCHNQTAAIGIFKICSHSHIVDPKPNDVTLNIYASLLTG